jgi:hypothetical protein
MQICRFQDVHSDVGYCITLKEKARLQIQNQCRLHELIKPIRYCIHFTKTNIHSLLISPVMLPLINCYKINIITPEITQTSNMHPRLVAMSITTVHLTATSPLIHSYTSHSLFSLISLHHIPSYNNNYNTPIKKTNTPCTKLSKPTQL